MEDYYCHDDYFDELDDGEDYCYDEDNEDDKDDEGYIPPLARSIYFNDWKIYELVVRKNFYTAIASSNVLIADIDCGNNVKEHLKVLRKFVNANDACFLCLQNQKWDALHSNRLYVYKRQQKRNRSLRVFRKRSQIY